MLFTVIRRQVWASDFDVWGFFVFCFFQSCNKQRGGGKEIRSFKLPRCAYSLTCSEHGWSNAERACHIQCAKSIFMSIRGLGCSPSPYGGGPAAAAALVAGACLLHHMLLLLLLWWCPRQTQAQPRRGGWGCSSKPFALPEKIS